MRIELPIIIACNINSKGRETRKVCYTTLGGIGISVLNIRFNRKTIGVVKSIAT